MKKTFLILINILITMILISCVTKYKIQETEYQFIPYKGNEVLVFESNRSKKDTISLKTYKGWYKTERVPYRIFHNKYEKYGIDLVHHSSKIVDSIPDFLIEIFAFDWKGLRINIRTKSDNHNYVNKTSFTVFEFDSIPNTEMKINQIIYSDVKVILGENDENKTGNQVSQFYWSEKNGLLGWDINNVEWRLNKRYVPQQNMKMD
ncbi:hypothetical protein [Aquimarina sp. Aq107]|uniref:hypothetical protein n=1 Tax=Aquimarina sp. Aq107 TaxID=1191912 RepID=UPI00131F06EE|nr:hypothetical protein [Aquimarina sp. Aq107]